MDRMELCGAERVEGDSSAYPTDGSRAALAASGGQGGQGAPGSNLGPVLVPPCLGERGDLSLGDIDLSAGRGSKVALSSFTTVPRGRGDVTVGEGQGGFFWLLVVGGGERRL